MYLLNLVNFRTHSLLVTMDSEKEVLLSESEPSSPMQSAPHPLISHVTPAFVARPELLPMQHSTPIIEAPSPDPELGLSDTSRGGKGSVSPVRCRVEREMMEMREADRDRFLLEPDRHELSRLEEPGPRYSESRHASISHSLSGAGLSLSIPHSGSRHSLASRSLTTLTTSQEKKEREKRKEARKAKSAQLPAHGEVQKMEASLLKLLNDFNSGQLRAFDSAYSLEEMESVRDKQEAIARKHFELGAAQDLHPPLSDEGLAMNRENMERLMGNLEELSQAIGQLSCLDRMVDRGGRSMDLDRDAAGAGDSQASFSQAEERPLRISRRSTMSNATESTQILEADMDYVNRMSQRTLV